MLSQDTMYRLNRVSALYDVIVTWPFATPFTIGLFFWAVGHLHAAAGWAPLPELSVFGVLFGNFFGTVVLIWSAVRLHLKDLRLMRYDALGRWLFSAWMLNAALNGASPVIWIFIAFELSFAVLQSLPAKEKGRPEAALS